MNDASWQGPTGLRYPKAVKKEIIYLPDVFPERHRKWVSTNH